MDATGARPNGEARLAPAIRRARDEAGWTQSELAGRLGVSQATVSFWENGIEQPRLEHVIRLALEFPALIERFQGRERELLERVLRLERALFDGGCACEGCRCHDEPKNVEATTEHRGRNAGHTRSWHMKIAIAGKGGVGKTTLAGTLARLLARRRGPVLALDSDSNPNLALSLGLPQEEAGRVAAVGRGYTEWREDAEGHAYVHLTAPVSTLIADFGRSAPDGVKLMVMGEVLEASAGCRCSAHDLARGITGHLVEEADVIVLDMEAGLEHLGRGTTEHVDLLLIAVEPYYRALMTASRVHTLAEQLGLPRIAVVANRVRNEEERAAVEQFCAQHGLDLVALIPFDETVLEAERLGRAPLDHAPDAPAVRAMEALAEALVQPGG